MAMHSEYFVSSVLYGSQAAKNQRSVSTHTSVMPRTTHSLYVLLRVQGPLLRIYKVVAWHGTLEHILNSRLLLLVCHWLPLSFVRLRHHLLLCISQGNWPNIIYAF